MELTEFEELSPERLDIVGTPANGAPFLMLKALGSDEPAEKFVSAEERRKDAKSGVAMPNGAFPIPDEGHLRSAIGRLAEYKGDKAAAKHHIIERAKALGLTHLLPKDWHVTKDVDETDAAKKVPSQQSVEHSALPTADDALAQTRENHRDPNQGTDNPEQHGHAFDSGEDPAEGDGTGDTAPDKALRRQQAMRQTRANARKADEVDMTGDKAPDEDDEARDEAESQTRTEKGKRRREAANDADENPGSPAWEHKDAALMDEAADLLARALPLVREGAKREKAETRKGIGTNKTADALLRLADTNPAMKELFAMSPEEFVKVLDEAEARRAAAKRARKAARQEEAAKAAKKAAKEARKAEKAAKAGDAGDAVKSAEGTPGDVSALMAQLAEMQKQVEGFAAQDGKRVAVNATGVVPVLRGEGAPSVFKELEDRVAAAASIQEERQARQQLAAAKMIANENRRERDPEVLMRTMKGLGVPLLSNRHALPDDRDLRAV